MFYLSFFYLIKRSRSRPLLFILGEQILIVYMFTIHLGEVDHILNRCPSHFLRPLLFISRDQTSILYSHIYYL